jgi:cell pole-organizing protein PopZ
MTPPPDDRSDKDQSMDDILASIRRIMLDEQARLQDTAPSAPGAAAQSGSGIHGAVETPFTGAETVLVLDSSMAIEDLAEEPAVAGGAFTVPEVSVLPPAPHLPFAETAAEPFAALEEPGLIEVLPPDAASVDVAVPVAHEGGFSAEATVPGAAAQAGAMGFMTQQSIEALLAPAAAAAAAASVDALLRQLNDERRALLQSGPAAPSLTIEEVVRSELRPFLKSWLDENLPPLVERLVRVEITRLIGRSGL